MKYKFFFIACLLMISLTAFAQVDSVKYWKRRAEVNMKFADQAAEMARKTKLEADRWRYLFVANEISTRSQELNNKELAALLAVQAYNFNLKCSGYEFNNNVYAGLVAALKRYDSLPLKLNTPQSSALLPSVKTDSARINKDLIKAGANGDVIIITNGIVRKKLVWHQSKVEHIGISPLRKFMVTLSKDKTICIWNLSDLTKHPVVIKETASIEGVAFSTDESQILLEYKNRNLLFMPGL